MALLAWPSSAISDILDLEAVAFMLNRPREFSQTGDGTPYYKDLAPAMWMADVQSSPYYHADARQIMALLNAMEDDLASFYLHDPTAEYPQADPDGAIYGTSAPTVNSVNTDGRRLSLAGLPAGYVLTRADRLAIDYLSPAQRSLYEVVDATVTANGSGVTPEFQVTPIIRTGVTAGDSVNLIKPAAIMKIKPGSLSIKTDGGTTSRITFSAIEDPKAEVA